MYAFGRWNEEKVIQGLAVAICLAMVGLAVMPAVGVGDIAAYYAGTGGNPYVSSGLVITSVGLLKLTDAVLLLELAGSAIAFPLTLGLIAGSVLVAA